MDAISYPSVPGATESSVLGPFHDEEAHSFQYGESIAATGTPGEPTIVQGYVKDTDGNPVSKALIDVWETDGDGVYDLEYEVQDSADPNCRGKVATHDDGHYLFSCVKPVAYPISNDGPVGELLRTLKRHWYRPAHMVSTFPCPGLVLYHSIADGLVAFYDRASAIFQVDYCSVFSRQQVCGE